MPYPAHTARIVLHATVAGVEEMQTGFWVQYDASASPLDAQAIANEMAPLATTFLEAIQQQYYQTVVWDRVDVYTYDAAGTKASGQGVAAINVAGTLTDNGAALDTCGVLTLLSGLPGRSRRGRMYLPYHAAISNGSTLSAAYMGARANALVDFFDGVNTTAGAIAASIVSAKLTASFPVTGVQYDTVPDVQRRRVNQLSSARTTVPV